MTRLRSNDFVPVASCAIHNGVIAARRTSESIGQSPLSFGALEVIRNPLSRISSTDKAEENGAVGNLYAFLNHKSFDIARIV